MKIRARLILLLAGLLAAFGVVAALMQRAHRLEAESMLANLRAERSALLDRFLALTGQPLASFARDYSLWDEMVEFTQTADPAWAAINIKASLTNFESEAAWVIRPNGTLLYAVYQTQAANLESPPSSDATYLDLLRKHGNLHYFQPSAAGLIEVRTSPILPSADIQRQQAARGWFVVARVWNEKLLSRLADTLGSAVSFTPPPSSAEQLDSIILDRTLTDWRGQPVQTLYATYQSLSIRRLLEGNRDETLLLYLFGILAISVVVFGVSIWILRPLQQLGNTLTAGSAEPSRSLLGQHGEFGQLARLVAGSFEQRDALRITESNLRHAIELRSRLARDLHDGIIQSIYSAGLGLEIAHKQLASDPALAGQRLVACQKTLNDTLRQVRQFIDDLEPDADCRQSPTQSLAALTTSMQSLQSIPITTDIDHGLTGRIGIPQEIHLLQITRELLSNAFRHSGAKQVMLKLKQLPDDCAELVISDDGSGFTPAGYTGKGRGLSNLAARARELNAELTISSSPGNGTRISLKFRPIN